MRKSLSLAVALAFGVFPGVSVAQSNATHFEYRIPMKGLVVETGNRTPEPTQVVSKLPEVDGPDARAFASSSYGGNHAPWRAFKHTWDTADGYYAWCSGNGMSLDSWIGWNFGEATTVSAVTTKPRHDWSGTALPYHVEGSNDGVLWTLVFTDEAAWAAPDARTVTFTPVTFTQYRLRFIGAAPSNVACMEDIWFEGPEH